MFIGGGWKDMSSDQRKKQLDKLKDAREDARRKKRGHAELDRKIREREAYERPH